MNNAIVSFVLGNRNPRQAGLVRTMGVEKVNRKTRGYLQKGSRKGVLMLSRLGPELMILLVATFL
jgi:hypothetical protein